MRTVRTLCAQQSYSRTQHSFGQLLWAAIRIQKCLSQQPKTISLHYCDVLWHRCVCPGTFACRTAWPVSQYALCNQMRAARAATIHGSSGYKCTCLATVDRAAQCLPNVISICGYAVACQHAMEMIAQKCCLPCCVGAGSRHHDDALKLCTVRMQYKDASHYFLHIIVTQPEHTL